MKKSTLFSLLFWISFTGFAQITLDPNLSETMNNSTEDEKIEVVAVMKSQYNREQLNLRADDFATKHERRRFVVNELKAFSESSQQDLRQTLSEMERQGMVSSVRSIWSANALYFSATKSALLALSERTDIKTISLNIPHPLIPEGETASASSESREIAQNIIQVRADQVWEQGYTGQGVVVAVVDSGVNYDHLDLADHLWDGGEEFPHHGYDIVNDDDDPMDDKGHGTHCAGTVCGDGTAGSLTGIAPETTLMCVKSIRGDGFGGAVNITGGMEWAVEHGCDVISMSLGMVDAQVADKEILRRTCEAVLDAGIIALVCAGNEGYAILQMTYPVPNNVRVPASCPPPYLDPDQMVNPGALSCVMAIGAVNYNDAAADFSSRGPVTWQNTEFGDYAYEPGIGLIRPDVCAPGVNIKSLDYNNISGYTNMDGTSQATPCVAGIVALMLQKNPELTPAQICQILEETSVKLTPNKSNVTGVGRVDALAAINAVPTWDEINENPLRVRIFPNPSPENITIQCEDMRQLEIFSIDGRLVLSLSANDNEYVIGGLESGVYLVRIKTNKETIVRRIVKM